MTRKIIAHLELDGVPLRGPFPAGHQWRLRVIGKFSRHQREVHAVLVEGRCRCGRKLELMLGEPYCWGLLDPREGKHIFDALLVDLYDAHFGLVHGAARP